MAGLLSWLGDAEKKASQGLGAVGKFVGGVVNAPQNLGRAAGNAVRQQAVQAPRRLTQLGQDAMQNPVGAVTHIVNPILGGGIDIINNSLNQIHKNPALEAQINRGANIAATRLKNAAERVPQSHLANVQYSKNPLLNVPAQFAASLPDMVLNVPSFGAKTIGGLAGYSRDLLSQGTSNPVATGQAVGNIADTAGNAFNTAAPFAGVGSIAELATKSGAEKSIGQKLATGALEGAKGGGAFGGFTGLTEGISQNRDKNLPGQVTAGLVQGAESGAMNAALGGALGVAGEGVGLGVKQAMSKLSAPRMAPPKLANGAPVYNNYDQPKNGPNSQFSPRTKSQLLADAKASEARAANPQVQAKVAEMKAFKGADSPLKQTMIGELERNRDMHAATMQTMPKSSQAYKNAAQAYTAAQEEIARIQSGLEVRQKGLGVADTTKIAQDFNGKLRQDPLEALKAEATKQAEWKNNAQELHGKRTIADLSNSKSKPDKQGFVTLYRGSNDSPGMVRSGSYLTDNPEVAKQYGKVETIRVKADELVSNGEFNNTTGKGLSLSNVLELKKQPDGTYRSAADLYNQATKPPKPKIYADNYTGPLETPLEKFNRLHNEKLAKNNLTQNQYADMHDNVAQLDRAQNVAHKQAIEALANAERDSGGKLTKKGQAQATAGVDAWSKAQEDYLAALNKVRAVDGQLPLNNTGSPVMPEGQGVKPMTTLPTIPSKAKAIPEAPRPATRIEPIDTKAYIKEQTRLQEEAAGRPGSKATAIRKEFAAKGLDALAPIERPVEIAAGGRKNTVALRNQLDRSLRSDMIAGQYAKDNGLHNIVNSVDDTKAFDQYLLARHGEDLTRNGIKTGRNAQADAKLLAELGPKYEAQAKAISEYNSKLLDKTVEYGLISPETATMLKEKYPNYVPFDRIFKEGELTGGGNGAGPASLSTQTVIQRIKGSERQVHSPLESILAKTHDVIAQGERNMAAKEIIKTAALPGNPLGIVPLRTAENVNARIDLYSQAKELRPVQRKLEQLTKTRKGWAESLQREVDKLNKAGLAKSLKAERTNMPDFNAPGLEKLKTRDTRSFINSLVNKPSSEIRSIKNKIATRENKLGPILDELSSMSDALQGVRDTRSALFDEARLHADAQAKGKATISTITNGIKEIYETTPEVAQAAKSLNKQQLGLVGNILAQPTRALRLGATGVNAGFALANVAKDTASAFINSEHPLQASIANPKVFMQSLAAAFYHGGKSYGELVREGAGGTSFDIARNSAKESIGKIRAEKGVGSKALYTVRHPSELLRAVEDTIGRSEEFGRAVQYFGNKSAALREGKTLAEAKAYGADAARNNTVNFARAGEYGRVVNSVLPYVNAGVQGSRTLMRNLRDRPTQTATKIALTGFFPVAVTTAWALNDPKRKEAYDDLQEYEKQGNIIIVPPNPVKDPKTNRWNVIKIPVSQEIANLNNIVRNGIEALSNDKNFDFAAMAGDLAGTATSLNLQNPRQAMGQLTPQAVKPGIEMLTNQNLFTGNQIVPDSQKMLDPRDQYGATTSGTAKTIGSIANLSPRQIDNFIRTTTGGAGQTALYGTDTALAKAGVIKPEDVRGTSVGTSIMNRFNSAAGLPEYAGIDSALKDKTTQLKNTNEYKALDPTEKAAALQRLSNDVIKATKLSIDAKNQKPGWGTDKNGKQIKLSDRQAGLLDGKTDVKDYLTTKAQKEAAGISTSTKAANPKDKYQKALEAYNKDKKAGNISAIQDLTKQSELTRLKARSSYSQDANDLYDLSYSKIVDYVNNDTKNGKKLWNEVQALDKSMTDAGYTSKLYDKYGNLKKIKTSGGGKGRKGKKVNLTAFNSSLRKITSSSKGKGRLAVSVKVPNFKTTKIKKIAPPKRIA